MMQEGDEEKGKGRSKGKKRKRGEKSMYLGSLAEQCPARQPRGAGGRRKAEKERKQARNLISNGKKNKTKELAMKQEMTIDHY